MSSELALKTVVAFNKLPGTAEKDEISRQYLSDEIGSYEFFCLANKYLDKVQSESKPKGQYKRRTRRLIIATRRTR